MGSNAAHARRARQFRLATGMSGPQLAKKIGVGYTTWQNVEAGYPLGGATGRRVEDAFPGMAAEWITRGWTGNLSLDWATKLGLAQRPTPPPPEVPRAKVARRR